MKKISFFVFPVFLIVILIFTPYLSASSLPDIESLFNQGTIAYHEGNVLEALAKWQKGFELADLRGNEKLTGVFAANIGLAYADLRDYENALRFYEKALQVNQKIGNLKNSAINLNNIGALYKDSGNPEKALASFKQAIEIRRISGDLRGTGKVLMNLCAVYIDSGNYKAAFKSIEEAISVFSQIKDQHNETAALVNLGLVFADIGQYKNALEMYKKAMGLNKSINDSKIQAHIFENIGSVYIQQKAYHKAILYYQKALDMERENNNRNGVGNVLCNLGVAYKQLGDLNNALKHYEDALAIKRFLEDRPGEGAILGNIGLVYEKSGKFQTAHDHLIESHQICMAYDLPEYRWRALRGLAKVEAGLELHDKAIHHYQLALDEIEKMRERLGQKEMKASFMQDKMHVYDELIELFATLNKKDPLQAYDQQSFHVFERKQGRVFIEEMGKSGVRNFSGIPSEIVGNEAQLSTELVKIKAAIEKDFTESKQNNDEERIRNLKANADAVNKRLQALRQTIKKDYPNYHALKYPQPVELKYLQQTVLESDEIMLVYSVMDDLTFLWAIAKDHFSIHQIKAGTDDFTQKVVAYRNNYINIFKGQKLRGVPSVSEPAAGAEKTQRLHSLLFPKAVCHTIKKYSTIYIIPTGPLYLLPFESLKNDSGQYLIENHSFAYLSSASLLNVLRATREQKKIKPKYPFLAFANPLYEVPSKFDDTVEEIQVRSFYNIMRGNIDALPETEDEVVRIKNILNAPAASHPLQTQKNASRSVLFELNAKGSLENYRYISFACHGILPDDVNGVTQPSLLLSTPDPVTDEIGLLTMSDVFGLKLNADLVALSACNTGRGEIVRGEGVIGLTRAFMYAGTPAISVNLWSVETISAQKLSVDFFNTLQQGRNRAASLRESKLKLIRGEAGKQFQLPFFWAPMIIFGDGS